MFSVGLSLVIATLGAGQGLGEPGSEMGRDEAVAAIRGLRGRVRYDEESPDKRIVLVDLVETDVVDADLVFLKGMTHLRTLYLNGTRVTDAGLQHLKGLTSLETLRLGASVGDFGGRYRGLAQVTDAGLEHLKGLANLRVLQLLNTQVTDAGLEHLKGLASSRACPLAANRSLTPDWSTSKG